MFRPVRVPVLVTLAAVVPSKVTVPSTAVKVTERFPEPASISAMDDTQPVAVDMVTEVSSSRVTPVATVFTGASFTAVTFIVNCASVLDPPEPSATTKPTVRLVVDGACEVLR